MESAPKRFLVETEAQAENKAGEDPEIDENDDPVADPPQAAANEGVQEKTGSRGGKRNRWSPICGWNGKCQPIPKWWKDLPNKVKCPSCIFLK